MQELITRQQLEARLWKISRPSFCGITALTEPRMRKTGNPYAGKAIKLTRAFGIVFFTFTRSVNAQRAREAQPSEAAGSSPEPEPFKAGPRQWGTRIPGTCLVAHCGDDGAKVYLEMRIDSDRCTSWYFNTDTGAEIDNRALAPFLDNRTSTNQRVKKPVILRDYRTDHIAELRAQGKTLTVSDHVAELSRLRLPADALT